MEVVTKVESKTIALIEQKFPKLETDSCWVLVASLYTTDSEALEDRPQVILFSKPTQTLEEFLQECAANILDNYGFTTYGYSITNSALQRVSLFKQELTEEMISFVNNELKKRIDAQNERIAREAQEKELKLKVDLKAKFDKAMEELRANREDYTEKGLARKVAELRKQFNQF